MGRYGKLGLLQRVTAEDRRIADESLEKVQLSAFADRQISQLSGGQQQRVFLARALAQQSDIYLMDEPFAAVDAATERAIVQLLREMREQGRTVLVVHHDLTSAPEYFDHLLLLNLRLVAFGKTSEVWTPDNLQKTYGGPMTLLSEMALKKFSQ
jgi:manganese/zinc/iron transport system ATP- binding protein